MPKVPKVMKKRIRIQGTLTFLSIIATAFLSKYLFQDWKEKVFDEFWDVLGIVIILLGFLFRIVARGYKEENSSAGNRLIKDGPYALMRNPMYLGTLLIGLGITLVIFQWWVFLLFLTVFFLIYFPQVKSEENVLGERFGKEYKTYCKLTPRCMPNLLLKIKKMHSCLRFKLAWVKSELVSLTGIVGLVIFAEAWKEMKLFGRQEYWFEAAESIVTVVIVAATIIFLFCEKGNAKKTE